jgi:hypothetical protein
MYLNSSSAEQDVPFQLDEAGLPNRASDAYQVH